jgi:hypothetical protein
VYGPDPPLGIFESRLLFIAFIPPCPRGYAYPNLNLSFYCDYPYPAIPSAPPPGPVLWEDPYELCIPGRLDARFLKSYFTFNPVLADVSMNYISSKPYSLANIAPSSVVTYLFSSSSILLPTKTIIMSSPPESLLLFLAWSIHFYTFSNDYRAIDIDKHDRILIMYTYKLYRSKWRPLTNLKCIEVSSNGISPIQQYPKLTYEPSYHQRIWSWSRNQCQQSPIKHNSINKTNTYLLFPIICVLWKSKDYWSFAYWLIAKKDNFMFEEHLIIRTHFWILIFKY